MPELGRIKARAAVLRETDLELRASEEAAKQNTSTANVLKAILRREREAGIFLFFDAG